MSTIRKILLLQVLITAGLAVGAWFWRGADGAQSAAIGGALCVVPNAFLGMRLVMSAQATSNPRRLLRAAWLAEIGKLVLTGVLFGFVFVVLHPAYPVLVFVGFIIAQSGTLAGLLMQDGVKGTT